MFGGPDLYVFDEPNDTLDTSPVFEALAFADENVGVTTFAITTATLESTDAVIYTVVDLPSDATITPAPLTIIASDQSKNEGTAFVFDGTEFVIAESTQLRFDDNVASVSFSSLGAPANANADGSPYAIDASNAVGDGVENYDISFVPGLLTVTETVEQPKPPGDFGEIPPQNPDDAIQIVPGTDGGATAEIVAAQETLGNVDGIADTLEARAASCAQSSGNTARYLACLSDALDGFTDELDNIAEDLPTGLRNVARIVQDARVEIDAARVRAQSRLATATTDAERAAIRRDAFAESRAALDTASAEIRKAIALVRVDDPELANIQRATITRVATTFDNVGVTLTRVTEL